MLKYYFILLFIAGFLRSQAQELISFQGSNYKIGYKNKAGEIVIKPRYDKGKEFKGGYAVVRHKDKWGVIDARGKKVVKPKYEAVKNFKDGIALVKREGKWGMVDQKGKELTPLTYTNIYHFSQGYLMVQNEIGKYGIINEEGETVAPLKYDNIAFGSKYDRYVASKNALWGFLDGQGKEVIPFVYEETEAFNEIDGEILAAARIPSEEDIYIDLEGNFVKTKEVDDIFFIVQDIPVPRGGMSAFYTYVGQNLRYPKSAKRIGVEGQVNVQFVVEKDGHLGDIKVLKGIGAGCDEEAVRVLKNAPRWTPGKYEGKPVRVRMVMPINFKLN